MAALNWGLPFLFLYSLDDPLCDALKLKELIAEKRSRGQIVEAVEWEKSEHCGHLKHHKDEYATALTAFLEKVMAGGGVQEKEKHLRSRL